jgi:hypothetical protein
LSESVNVPVPPPTATLEERGAVLRVTSPQDGALELRVDDGFVFARYLSREPQRWTSVSPASISAFFAQNSPVGTFLRQQGVSLLQQLLVDCSSAPGDTTV